MKYTAFLFDFDYTLGDATEGIVGSFNHSFKAMGLPECPKEKIQKPVGLTLADAFTILTKIDDEQQVKDFLIIYREKADEIMLDNTHLFDDTIETLTYLKSRNVAIGIVTTKLHYRIQQVVDKFNINHLIDNIVGFDDVQAPKPSPEGLLFAVNKLGVNKKNVLYIGDNPVDAKAALAADIDFAAVTTGTTEREEFLQYPHIAVISRLAELKEYIK